LGVVEVMDVRVLEIVCLADNCTVGKDAEKALKAGSLGGEFLKNFCLHCASCGVRVKRTEET
jgi:hypothetical protein